MPQRPLVQAHILNDHLSRPAPPHVDLQTSGTALNTINNNVFSINTLRAGGVPYGLLCTGKDAVFVSAQLGVCGDDLLGWDVLHERAHVSVSLRYVLGGQGHAPQVLSAASTSRGRLAETGRYPQ